jgi:peptide/nickel transport system permease protein
MSATDVNQPRETVSRGPEVSKIPPWAWDAWRLVSSVAVTLLGLLALTFFIGRMLPIDPVIAIVGEQADASTYDMVYKQLGLDKPLYVQFSYFIGDMMRGEFGNALFTGNKVSADLMRVFPATIELATIAITLGVLIGVPIGVLAAVYRGSPIDHVARILGLLGYSVPTFWLGLMGLVLLYAALGWVGGPGRLDVFYIDIVDRVTGLLLLDAIIAREWEVLQNAVSHIVLPASILSFNAIAFISRLTRSFMLAQLSQEYILAARVKGLSKWKVIRKHAFRNIAVQLLTIIALAYGILLEGAVVTETVFAWPGFGRYLVSGLLAGDMNAVLACVLMVGVIFVSINLFCDLLYRILDPRTK